jgi:glutathione S-transferase
MATPSITLFGVAASRAFRNLWMLNELGVAFEHNPIHYTDPALKTAPFIDMNPNGRIPILQFDDFVVTESLAINLYLARRVGSTLSPQTLEQESLATQWSMWAAAEFDEPMVTWAVNTIVKPEAERDVSAASNALARMQKPLAVLEKVLSQSPYVMGSHFTVADLNVASVMYRGLWMDLAQYPKVQTWLKASFTRPAALVARRARGETV